MANPQAKRATRLTVDYKEVAAYAIVAVLALLLAVLALQLWKADLRVPFTYGADANLNGVLVKTSMDHGWIQANPTIGLPGQFDLADFPFGETLDFAIMKVISIFARDWALSMNLFYLLTFPLTAVLAMWTMLRLGISRWPAAAMSLVYTILPYHFLRGESHLGLAAYFLAPPMILVCVWSMADEPLLFVGHGAKRWKLDLKRPEALIAIAICVLTAFGGVYYAFFACFFLFVAGAIGALRHGKGTVMASALLLIVVIVGAGAINLSPSLVYHLQHGGNAAASVRNPGQAEIYGLKIDQMFLPVDGHRIGKFAAIKALYHQGMAQINRYLDNEAVVTSPLGIVGVLGFLLVFFGPFLGDPVQRWFGKQRFERLQQMGQLTILGTVLATVGGFGAMIALRCRRSAPTTASSCSSRSSARPPSRWRWRGGSCTPRPVPAGSSCSARCSSLSRSRSSTRYRPRTCQTTQASRRPTRATQPTSASSRRHSPRALPSSSCRTCPFPSRAGPS